MEGFDAWAPCIGVAIDDDGDRAAGGVGGESFVAGDEVIAEELLAFVSDGLGAVGRGGWFGVARVGGGWGEDELETVEE